MYSLEYTRTALKDMTKLPAQPRKTVEQKLQALARHLKQAANVKALKGEDGAYRLRVGDYRAVYYLEQERLVVIVVRVQHRKDVYR